MLAKQLLLLIFLSTALSGCGSSQDGAMTEVTGTVSLNGQKLRKGTISFENSEKGEAASGDIKDGKFTLKAPVGEMIVRINAMEEFGRPDETGARPTRNLVPPNYNTESELKRTVKSGGPNNFELRLIGRR